jgi:uncharacterized membrane protein YagU involved in acid resistance
MEPIIYYFIIAIAFALSSLYTVHIKSLTREMPNFWEAALWGGATWLVVSTVLFPFILSAMFKNWDAFLKGYKEGLHEVEDED